VKFPRSFVAIAAAIGVLGATLRPAPAQGSLVTIDVRDVR